KRLFPPRSVTEIRSFTLSEVANIKPETRRLVNPQTYWVGLSHPVVEEKRSALQAFWSRYSNIP
ncbi:MAG: hypothetical protein K6U00_06120, partial [Armatimonadetes bacterium]|nr:hypothetical protein [Armatimonadota bacterium]